MSFRELFTEMPYGAALKSSLLNIRCSTCFAKEAKIPCMGGCEKVVYCDEKCRGIDASSHKYECLVFQSNESIHLDKFTRLLVRILTRQMIDDGVAHLCQNFPENIRDRRLSDLMSHQSDIESCDRRREKMDESLAEFKSAFENTPLVDDMNLVRRMYCVMWINCFSVSGAVSLNTGYESALGLGFYLNTSRFNHSCVPDLRVDFDGSRLLMLFPSLGLEDATAAKERSRLTESVENFNQLTISYGFSSSFTNDSFFPLRYQRRASLEFAYYFKCECVLCADEIESAMEEHAAAIECGRCGKALLWVKVEPSDRQSKCWAPSGRSKVTCVKTCSCETDADEMREVSKFVKRTEPRKTLAQLDWKWTRVMGSRLKDMYANQIVEMCEPVFEKAIKIWHPSANLRLAQLTERLFISYSVIVTTAWKEQCPIDTHALKMGLKTGELLVSWTIGRDQNMYMTATAAYCNDLAHLFEIAATTADSSHDAADYWSRATQWYNYAASIWKTQGHRAAHSVAKLVSCAEETKKKSTAAAEMESKMWPCK